MKKVTYFAKEYYSLREWRDLSGLSKEDAFEIVKRYKLRMVMYHNRPCFMGAELQKTIDKRRCTQTDSSRSTKKS